ncbi:protein Skeletor, isoforms B/C-like [Ornithodoros turicata]
MAGSWSRVWLALLLCGPAVVLGKYYGKLIGDLQSNAHGVKGKVYAANSTTLQLVDFSYDGSASEAYFAAGTSQGSVFLSDENGGTASLKRYNKRTFLLPLPVGTRVTDLDWFGVGPSDLQSTYGSLTVPAGFQAPAPVTLSPLKKRAHNVGSGPVVIMNHNTIFIPKFTYDGSGPDVYFLVGKGNKPTHKGATKIPTESGEIKLKAGYKGTDMLLRLPGSASFTDFDWFSVYCIRFEENFGDVTFPKNMNLPAV